MSDGAKNAVDIPKVSKEEADAATSKDVVASDDTPVPIAENEGDGEESDEYEVSDVRYSTSCPCCDPLICYRMMKTLARTQKMTLEKRA